MASAARVLRTDLEALLRARKLDQTLPATLPARELLDEHVVAQTGVAVLDERLNGGLMRGEMSEVVGDRSSGRTSLLCAMFAAATRRGEMVALVDALDMFDVVSAAGCGIDLGRLLWIRGQDMGIGRQSTVGSRESAVGSRLSTIGDGAARGTACCAPTGVLWDRTVDRAVKALNLALQAGIFGVVALDLAEVPVPVVRRLPYTTWLRLQRVIEGSETACVLLGAAPMARSAGGVTITVRRQSTVDSRQSTVSRQSAVRRQSTVSHSFPGIWGELSDSASRGNGRRARLLLGFEVEAYLSRASRPEATPCRFQIGSCNPAPAFPAPRPWPLAPGS